MLCTTVRAVVPDTEGLSQIQNHVRRYKKINTFVEIKRKISIKKKKKSGLKSNKTIIKRYTFLHPPIFCRYTSVCRSIVFNDSSIILSILIDL